MPTLSVLYFCSPRSETVKSPVDPLASPKIECLNNKLSLKYSLSKQALNPDSFPLPFGVEPACKAAWHASTHVRAHSHGCTQAHRDVYWPTPRSAAWQRYCLDTRHCADGLAVTTPQAAQPRAAAKPKQVCNSTRALASKPSLWPCTAWNRCFSLGNSRNHGNSGNLLSSPSKNFQSVEPLFYTEYQWLGR